MTGLNAPPATDLHGSIFKDFTIPGLTLFVLVGGGALLAAILLLRKDRFGTICAAASGLAIIFFEFVEVLVIGAPPGIARTLQIFHFGLEPYSRRILAARLMELPSAEGTDR
jgi:hypothetical protein